MQKRLDRLNRLFTDNKVESLLEFYRHFDTAEQLIKYEIRTYEPRPTRYYQFHASPVSSLASLNLGFFKSFSDKIGFLVGHSIAISGSFHIIPASLSLLYSLVVLYKTSVSSSSDRKPCANPGGIHSMFLFSSDKYALIHFPNIKESFLISTATSKIFPVTTLTSFPCSYGFD